jgi:hydroxylamine dehydrogenase
LGVTVQFRSVFVAVFIGSALVVAAVLVNGRRPARETSHGSAALVKATGKCAECHRRETSAVVHQFERSRHAQAGINCLECHRPSKGQETVEHRGFEISAKMTSLNCKQCHPTEYDQFNRSRHALPAYAAVNGTAGVTPEQLAQGERFHPGACDRPPNGLAILEGPAAKPRGCIVCHEIGAPNADGSIGTCTQCHSRHNASVALARSPATCGQCHMGPDHSQIEIYNESKHGAIFAAQRPSLNLDARPKMLSTADMPVPTCATCHMSGLEGLKVTHDTTERLSWFLFAPVSQKRPGYEQGQVQMKEVCLKCHAKSGVERFYAEAEVVVDSTNAKITEMQALVAGLRKEGLMTPEPFDEEMDFLDFDIWHYYGRTAKHGAFMGGADFVQWHGNYELLKLKVEMETLAKELREKKASGH